jgi:hypothetical protein
MAVTMMTMMTMVMVLVVVVAHESIEVHVLGSPLRAFGERAVVAKRGRA